MTKYRLLIDTIIMVSISIFMVVQIDKYYSGKEHLESISKMSMLEYQRDSVINLYFERKLDSATNVERVKVNIHNSIIRENVNFDFSTYPIFSILSDKSIDGHVLLSLHEYIFIDGLVYSDYKDTVFVKHKNNKTNKNFITHFNASSEAIVFNMYYPSVQSDYSVMPTVFEKMMNVLAYSDSAFIDFKGENETKHYILDSIHIQFIHAIHQICNFSKELELELLNNDSILQLQNGRYLEY